MKEIYSKPAKKTDIIPGSRIFGESVENINSVNKLGQYFNGTLARLKKIMKKTSIFTVPIKVLKIVRTHQHNITIFEEALEEIKWFDIRGAAKKKHYKSQIKRLKSRIQFIDSIIAKEKIKFEKRIKKDPDYYKKRVIRMVKITERHIARLKKIKKRANLTLKKESVIIEKLYKQYLHDIEHPSKNPDKF